MSIETAIGDRIEAAATALSDRIYPLQIPAGAAFPNAVVQRIATRRDATLGGPNGVARVRVQVDIFAKTQLQARALADAVRGLLDGFAGTQSGVVVQDSLLENEHDLFDEQTGIYRTILEFQIRFEE
ncbi:MAG: DUF3168 domain-containing protein [Robiginitomaculum sp.]|nr:DUF3168 domain-containing protein [Robiginitomaculum sp.]PCI51393.1 MAG: hypothetical protein COB49_01950 [Alphaproteobacteria bacterium]